MKKFYVLLTLLMTLFVQTTTAEQVGYKFPSDGTFSNATENWYKTWTSNDGVLKIEGSTEYSFYPLSNRVCIYGGTYTISVTEGNSIISYAINNPRGGKSGDTSSQVVFYDASNNATSITTGTWSDFNLEYTINAQSTTFTISATGDDPYMAVYTDYFVTNVDVNNAGGGGGGETTSTTVTFATGGNFSNPTTMPDASVYYKTWTSTDGNITITGTSGTSFYDNTDSWYILEEGTYTISSGQGNITSYTIRQPYGYDGAGLITAEDGSTLTVPNGDFATTLTVNNVNATSTTFTVSGDAGTIWLYDGYMTITYEAENSGDNPGGDDNTYLTYTLEDGTFSEPYDETTYAAYLKTWISNDSVVSLTGSSRYNFYFAEGAGTDITSSSNAYFYANNRNYTVNVKDGYELVYLRLAYPYSYYADATLVAEGGISWSWPQNSYPTPEYMDLSTTQFTIQGSSDAMVLLNAAYVTFYLKQTTTGINTIPEKPAIKDNIIYDLQGRRVQTPQKGIYIVNGKKVVFK